MSRSYKLYLLFTLVGVALAGWTALNWQRQVDHRFDAVEKKGGRPLTEPAPRFRDLYDHSGRRAALRVLRPGEPPRPLFWARGSLRAVMKRDWQEADLHYGGVIISRSELHDLLQQVDSLPEKIPGDDILDVQRHDARGRVRHHFVPTRRIHDLIGTWLGSRTLKPYTLQGIRLDVSPAAPGPAAKPWPFHKLSWKQLVRMKTMTVRERPIVRKLQEILLEDSVWRLGESRFRIRAQAMVDR